MTDDERFDAWWSTPPSAREMETYIKSNSGRAVAQAAWRAALSLVSAEREEARRAAAFMQDDIAALRALGLSDHAIHRLPRGDGQMGHAFVAALATVTSRTCKRTGCDNICDPVQEYCGAACSEQRGVRAWRVGRKLGHTLYIGETFIGDVRTPELAAQIVAAVNGAKEKE